LGMANSLHSDRTAVAEWSFVGDRQVTASTHCFDVEVFPC